MKGTRHNLAAATAMRFEQFLVECTNLRLEPDAVRRFFKRFPDFDLLNDRLFSALFTKPSSSGVTYSATEAITDLAEKYPFIASWDAERIFYVDDTEGRGGEDMLRRLVIPYFRAVYRATWIEPDPKARHWAWFMVRAELARMWEKDSEHLHLALWDSKFRWMGEAARDTAVRLPEPPHELPVEKALLYLISQHSRARYCSNDECPAPYFFAARHSQRYCSESCAQVGNRDAKRRWWAEKGAEWRKTRTQRADESKLRPSAERSAKRSSKAAKMTRNAKKGK